VVIHLVAQAGVADLVQAHELVEPVGAAVGHDQPVQATARRDSPERLDGPRLAEDPGAGGNQTWWPLCE
jgi:hypothetical protein